MRITHRPESATRLFLPIGLALILLSGCVSVPTADPDPAVSETNSQSKLPAAGTELEISESTEDSAEPAAELNAELLYDVLLASIAAQRQQPEVALEALSRAVYASR
ncbi:MAG: hypothetical protein ACR2QW_17765, partial [bacterium]